MQIPCPSCSKGKVGFCEVIFVVEFWFVLEREEYWIGNSPPTTSGTLSLEVLEPVPPVERVPGVPVLFLVS